jgi:hypothetical protein
VKRERIEGSEANYFSDSLDSTSFARIVGKIVTFSGKCHSDLALHEKSFKVAGSFVVQGCAGSVRFPEARK